MPRPKSANAPEPKKRSRNGCWPCKSRKIKCGEEKPHCTNCVKQGETCDYSIRLQWGGRSKKDQDAFAAISTPTNFVSSPGWTPSTSSTPSQTPAPHPLASPFQSSAQTNAATETMPTGGSRAAPTSAPQASMIDPQLMASNNSSMDAGQLPAWKRQEYQQADVNGGNFPPMFQPYYPAAPHTMQPVRNDQSMPSPNRSLPYPMPQSDFIWSDQHRVKRVKGSPSGSRNALRSVFVKPDLPESSASNTFQYDQGSPGSLMFTPLSANTDINSPNTPDSSLASEEPSSRFPRSGMNGVQQSPDLRRLSVNSLLSGPPGNNESHGCRETKQFRYPRTDDDGSTIYGYDYGYPDLDVSKNNDSIAIVPESPAVSRSGVTSAAGSPFAVFSEAPSPALSKDPAFQRGGYYAQPVPIIISKEFEPLPSYLADSPMNLLYFHHFLNHTARVLTPHDCPDNPLRTILPKMAMHNPDLLNLIFAYSASHRARLLSHPEPKDRIAYWVRDVFPNLRHALSSPDPVSDATLATAIMLASREIITPNTFEVNIPWQNHLGIARQMIIQRGGLKDMGDHGSSVVNFLARWFAYLDVIGSLSGHKNEVPLSEAYWSFPQDTMSQRSKSSIDGDDHGFAIDCFFGFTNCCISLLARVAKLAHECDKARIDADGNANPDWKPCDTTKESAEQLVTELSENQGHVYAGCRHNKRADSNQADSLSDTTKLDLQEIVGVNEAFHLAGLIHLYRRVLGKQSSDDEVQQCVRRVLAILGQVRKGGTAESCLLFPMFTAGCDAIEAEDREVILERLKLVEGLGMTHVQKARTLMQTSWETGKPWETLASGEFFG